MKSFNKITSSLRYALLTAILIPLLGCEGDGDAPFAGSTLTINPSETSWTTTTLDPTVCTGSYNDEVFKINAQREDNSPLGEATLRAIVTHGGNTTNNLQTVFLYADTNNNLVIDANEPIVNNPGDPAYVFSTDNQGEAHLNVRFLTQCGSYSGSIGVYGEGALVDFAEFTVDVVEDTP